FDLDAWFDRLRTMLGHGAEAMIAGEHKEHKYDRAAHAQRLERILAHWDDILALIARLPTAEEMRTFFRSIGHPVSCREFGLSDGEIRDAFIAAKDIRDKYVLGRLLWDLGLLEECADALEIS
ncbi:MAG: sn-glycerol-1-phosphate dehydrogenase, partial [Clostridia bacterium]|nr:sn-glycerol-1-phosphate dehydrogenase [Clostridia bacterium]